MTVHQIVPFMKMFRAHALGLAFSNSSYHLQSMVGMKATRDRCHSAVSASLCLSDPGTCQEHYTVTVRLLYLYGQKVCGQLGKKEDCPTISERLLAYSMRYHFYVFDYYYYSHPSHCQHQHILFKVSFIKLLKLIAV